MNQCAQCGKAVRVDSRFCGNCGSPTGVSNTNTAYSSNTRFVTAAIAVPRTIFITSPTFVNKLNNFLNDKGLKPFALLSGVNQQEISSKIASVRKQDVGKTVKYVCLVGSWQDVPPFRVPSPGELDDGDDYCFTDALYGCVEPYDESDISTAIPVFPVGRLPTTNLKTLERVLLNRIDIAEATNDFFFAVSARCWQEATETIVSRFLKEPAITKTQTDCDEASIPPKSILSSPDWEEQHLRHKTEQKISKPNGVLLFNVHGGLDEPVWVGQDGTDYPKIFDPDTIQDFNGSVLVCEACYGGALGYEPISIVESFFERGGLVFIGSSTIAYGSPNQDIAAADEIALYFLTALAQGDEVGSALNNAKKRVAEVDPLFDFIGKKTVLSFNLFGVPWQRMSKSTTAPLTRNFENDAATRIEQFRSRSASLQRRNDDTVNLIRDRYRLRMNDKQKQFFLDADTARAKLSRFEDYEKINSMILDWTGGSNNYSLQFVSNNGEEGYALTSSSDGYGKTKKTMVLLMNSTGKLRKTLTSKGLS
jgi:hypothetical protein